MNNALTKTCAGPVATARGPLVRHARRGAAVLILACVAVTAQAQHYGDRGAPRYQEAQGQQVQRGERFQLPPRQEPGRSDFDRDPRAFDSRADAAREEERRQMQQERNMRNAEARRGSRMTPDERRDLRRQINEAGIDLYQKPPRR